MTLLALAAVPVLSMSAYVALESYRASADQARQGVLLAREAAVARHEAALTSAAQLVASLARSPQIWSDSASICSTFLVQIAALNPDRYENVVAVDGDGIYRCGTITLPPDAPPPSYAAQHWFQRLLQTMRPIASEIQALGDDYSAATISHDAIVVAYPVTTPNKSGGFAGALVVFLRMDWFAKAAEVLPSFDQGMTQSWLIGPTASVTPIGGARLADLPEPAMLSKLLASDAGPRLSRSASGDLFAYASTGLPDQLRLLSGFRAGGVIGPAREVLVFRILVLGVLMLAGMAIVALGANRAVAEPVKALTKAVRRWRLEGGRGGAFDPAPGGGVPSEIAELTQAFSETSAALAAREAELRGALAHQDLLMQEIHHRVKNNLQIVASLLNLQANRITQPEARAEFQSARDRVRALATLHRHLYAEGELHTINMRGFLIELCGQLFQAMGESEGDRIQLEIEATELTMSSDQATPLSLIVTEAVSNALKYAFPDGRRGTIRVRLTAGPRMAELVIQDDGVGISPGRVETDTGTRDGLGLHLMRGFARQLGAELRVEHEPDGAPGTRYGVVLELHPDARASEPASAAERQVVQ